MTFAEKLTKIKKGDVVLVSVAPESYTEISHTIMKEMTKTRNQRGVCLTLTKSSQKLEEEFKNLGLDPKKLYFIDAANGKSKIDENHYCVESPAYLTEISMAITDSLSTEKYQFLYVDSVQTLMIYQDESIAEQFLYYLSRKIRLYGITGIMVLSGKETKKIEDKIAQFCDSVIKISFE